MLNKKQALELFEREAVCFDEQDGVPLYRVRQLFGKEAADFASRSKGFNAYGIGDANPSFKYVCLSGFLHAVTYRNVVEARDAEKEVRS